MIGVLSIPSQPPKQRSPCSTCSIVSTSHKIDPKCHSQDEMASIHPSVASNNFLLSTLHRSVAFALCGKFLLLLLLLLLLLGNSRVETLVDWGLASLVGFILTNDRLAANVLAHFL